MSSITISYDAAHGQPDSIVFNARPYSKTVIEPEQLSADQFFEVFVLNEDGSDLAESGPEYIIFNFAVYCKQNTDPADIADGVLRVSFPIYSNVQTEDASVVRQNFASQSNLAFQPNLVFQPNLTFQPNFAFHTSPASYPQQGNGLPPHQQAYGQQNQPPYPSKPPHNQQQSYGNQNSQSNIAYQPNVVYQPQLTFQPNFAFHAPQPNPTAQAGATSTAPGLSLPRTTLLNANYIPRPQGVQKKALVFGFDLPPHLRNTVQLNAPTLNYASDPSAQTNGTAVKRQRQHIIWAEADSKYFFQLIELALLTLGRRLRQFDFKEIAEALNRNFRGSTVYGNRPGDGDDNDGGNVPGGQEQVAGPSGQYGRPPYAPPQQAYEQYPGSQQYPAQGQYPANVPNGYGQYPDPFYKSF
ncbi:uncharacterized protein PAC_04767 [Phialocephala subalpina]|uniref:Uncharacterized protein n=1 Tax=Phialocephala subalpina TaxID=576137 RepID=A0A1L7WQ40_9HELO|nr:uncharacterized protein PAC_04767 [Phialocephala subalpina]